MADQVKLEILYDDKEIVAVNKPEGIASIAENDTRRDSIHSLLEKKLSQKIFIVHRLDKEVSGVILFAKNAATHKMLNRRFAGRTVKKSYLALVYGNVDKNEGSITKAIREFGSGRMGVDEKNGKPSSTNFKILKRFKEYTLLELNPSTGRRHQLRVHLYSIGHSIVGDSRYGDKETQKNFPRIMLHAQSIKFDLRERK
ncbi:MAG: RNA pseudouridine synthase, partial [Bacteroidetes bacterium]|nr:RNA pseudouridine synthase [Bacteroidota bacterium]